MHGLVCLVSTLMLIRSEAVYTGRKIHDSTTAAAMGMENYTTSTPKQVHPYVPIVSHDQLEVYSNRPKNSDQVCSLSSAMAQLCVKTTA